MSDLDFVKAYLAKHVEVCGSPARTKTNIQLKFAHEGKIDESIMQPDCWFTNDQVGVGLPRGLGTGGFKGLGHPPVSVFVYAFIRDNLELFRKDDGPQTTSGSDQPVD